MSDNYRNFMFPKATLPPLPTVKQRANVGLQSGSSNCFPPAAAAAVSHQHQSDYNNSSNTICATEVQATSCQRSTATSGQASYRHLAQKQNQLEHVANYCRDNNQGRHTIVESDSFRAPSVNHRMIYPGCSNSANTGGGDGSSVARRDSRKCTATCKSNAQLLRQEQQVCVDTGQHYVCQPSAGGAGDNGLSSCDSVLAGDTSECLSGATQQKLNYHRPQHQAHNDTATIIARHVGEYRNGACDHGENCDHSRRNTSSIHYDNCQSDAFLKQNQPMAGGGFNNNEIISVSGQSANVGQMQLQQQSQYDEPDGDQYAAQLRRSQSKIPHHQQQASILHQLSNVRCHNNNNKQSSNDAAKISIASSKPSQRALHVNFNRRSNQMNTSDDEEACETRKKKYLTAKYGQQQMNLIKKRLKIETWLHERLQELAKQSKSIEPDELDEIDIDLDHLLDMEDDATRRHMLKKTLEPLNDVPQDSIDKFISEVLEQSKLL